jgi:ABC-type nitrate/sulfonate/bicarbonate transport system ATPase subunit
VASLELADVSVELDGASVLAGVSLSVADGEFVGVVGPSGGGKSTCCERSPGSSGSRAARS